MKGAHVLGSGELYVHERFGPGTINRGAVLWECEWDGGDFESGVLIGGVFRAGVFRGGVVWAAYWKGGAWEGGFWHHGFGPDGAYRPRGAFPGSAIRVADAAEARIEERGGPQATVFAASVFGDLPRLWLACLRLALPAGAVTFELFDDSAEGSLDGRLLPGVAILGRSPARPDFQVAYTDALRRATTPLLVFVDTDVFWLSRDVWARVLEELERPRVAGVACLARAAAPSPGTFAVVMRTAVYREIVRRVPGGFAPAVEREEPGGAAGRWRGQDTADRVAREVRKAGFEVPTLDLEEGAFVRFDAITMTRLIRGWVDEETLVAMAAANPYFRRGCLGARALARVHDELFADGPRFGTPLRPGALWRALLTRPRALLATLRDAAEFRRGAWRIRKALESAQRLPRASA